MLHCPAPAAGRRDLTYKGSVPNHPTYNRGLPLPHWRHPPPGRHSCPHRYPISKREASKSMWTPDLSKPNPALQQLPQPNPQSSGCSAAVPLPSLSSLGISSSQFLVVQPLGLCRCLSSLITIVPSLRNRAPPSLWAVPSLYPHHSGAGDWLYSVAQLSFL